MSNELEFRNELLIVAGNMMKYGGNFVQCLASCILAADDNNIIKIKNAFPEYWEQYKNIGGKQDEEEKTDNS